MPELPQRRYVRRGHIREYFGISDAEITKLVAAGALVPVYLQGKGRAFFLRSSVIEAEQSGRVFNVEKAR